MPKRDKYWLKSFISRICEQIEEYRGRAPNHIEVQALIQRFVENNPDADPEEVDWVGVWDPTLTYSENLRRFQKTYPGYRWEREEVREEGYDEERYFSELLDYLRKQAEELPRELRLRLVRELSAELGLPAVEAKRLEEAIEAEAEKPPERPRKRVVVDFMLIAKYPPLPEAKNVAQAFRFDELDEAVYDRACERVLEAAERGIVSAKLEDPLTEFLSYPIATGIVAWIYDRWLASRYSLAEARRIEKLLMVDEPEVLEFVAKKCLKTVEYVLGSEDPEVRMSGKYGDYRIRLKEYLKVTTEARLNTDPRWKLINRVAQRGFIYLSPAELARIVRAYVQMTLRNAVLRTASNRRLIPPRIRDAAEKLRPRLGEVVSRLRREITSIPADMPPCMKLIQQRILRGEDVSHMENFALAAYLLNTGRSVEEVLQIFSHRSDYDERIARYQVEHIAGLRGSRTKYRPPACSKMAALGLCVEGGKHCPKWIRNPLQYRLPRSQKCREPSYID